MQEKHTNTIAFADIRGHCDAALGRLKMPFIDVFVVNRMNPTVPLEETMRGLKELVGEGKIKAVGLSEASAAQIRRAHAVHPVTLVEVEYSLFERGIEADILPTCRELGIKILAYSPLGRGMLTTGGASVGANDYRAHAPRFAPEALAVNQALADKLKAAAAARGCSASQLALAWLLAQGDDVIPIPGTTKLANFQENLGALEVKLTKAEADELAAAVPAAEVVGTRYPALHMGMTHEAMSTAEKASA